MKIRLITARDKDIWKPMGSGHYIIKTIALDYKTKLLDFIENFFVDGIKLSLFENKDTYYLGYLQGKNLYVGYDRNKDIQSHFNGDKSFVEIIENLKPEPVINYYMERFGLKLNTVILN